MKYAQAIAGRHLTPSGAKMLGPHQHPTNPTAAGELLLLSSGRYVLQDAGGALISVPQPWAREQAMPTSYEPDK